MKMKVNTMIMITIIIPIYENILSKPTDIMCLIFQFLTDFDRFGEYIGEFSNGSLVCSQWLYHVFNPNFYFNLV